MRTDNSPERPPDIEAHRVQPKERRQEQEVHADRCAAAHVHTKHSSVFTSSTAPEPRRRVAHPARGTESAGPRRRPAAWRPAARRPA